MIRLAITSLRHRIAGVLATVLAVLIGSALVTACGGLLETALRLDAPAQRYSDAPVVVTGRTTYEFADHSDSSALSERGSLSAAAVRAVAAAPNVERAVADVSFPAVLRQDGVPVRRGPGAVAGHPWTSAALTPYALDGAAPRHATDVVLDAATARLAGVGVGDHVQVAVDGTASTFHVTGTATPRHPVDGTALYFSDARGHSAQAVAVFPQPGTSAARLAASLRSDLPDGLTVHTGGDRGSAEFVSVGGARLPLIILSGVFGGLVIVVMSIVVAATVTLSVRQRHRELALLRATGATPFQVRRLVIAEAMSVAVFGTGAGIALGAVAGRLLFGQLTAHGIVPEALRFTQGPIPFAAGAIAALVAVRVASGLAARPAERLSAIEALRDADIPPVVVGPVRRLLAAILGFGTVALAVTTMFMTPTNAAALGGPAVLTGAIALALVAPVAVRWVAERVPGRGIDGRLAGINLRARAVQFGAVLTPITIATAIAIGNIYSQTTQDDAARSAFTDQLHADVVVTSDAGGIPQDLRDRVRALPSVTATSELVRSQGWLERPFDGSHTSDPLPLLGLSPQTKDPVYTGHVDAGSLTALHDGTVAVPTELAGELGIHVGDDVGVRLGDGTAVTVRVVATVEQPSGYEQLLLPAGLLAAHTTAQLPTQLLVRSDRPGEAGRALDGLLAGRSGLHRVGDGAVAEEFDAGLGVEAWINYLIAALAIAYAALATINTLAVSVLDRRREFGLQQLTGATRRQVLRMLHREVLVVGVTGLVAGLVIAGFTVLPIAVATGSVLPSGPWWVLAATVGVLALLITPVTAVAGRTAMRLRPVDAVDAPNA